MIALSASLRQAQLRTIATALDAGTVGGLLRIYSAPRADLKTNPSTATLLCELSFAKPCIASLDSEVLTLNPPTDRLCLRTGTANWARLLDGDGRTVLDLEIGLIGSDADLELDTLLLLAGGWVRLPALEFYAP